VYLSVSQLDAIQKEIDRVGAVRRSDGLIVGEYRYRLCELAETVLRVVVPEETVIDSGRPAHR
jgi:hypothetical protein